MFFMASGLKINLLKSKLYGVGVKIDQVSSMAQCMGCSSDTLTFIHLGVPVGQNMTRVVAWSSIIDRFRSRLAGGKAKFISNGGTLL